MDPRRQTGAALFALAVGGFGIGTTEFATMGLLPQVADGLDISIPTAGHAITAYALGVVVGAPAITAVAARMPRRRLLLLLMVAFAVGNALSALAPTPDTLIVARFLAGLPHGAYFGVASVVAASLVPPGKRGSAISLVMAGLTIANIAGVPAATLAGQQLGWRWAYAGVAVIGLLTVLAVRTWVPRTPAPKDASIARELTAFRRPQLLLALLTGAVGFGGMFALYSYISPTLTEVAGVGESAVPWVLALFGLGMTTGAIFGGRFIDRSPQRTMIGGLVAMGSVLAIYAATATSPVAAVGLVFVIGITTQTVAGAITVHLMDVSPDAPSLAAASTHSALNIANASGAWLGGMVIAAGHGYLATAWLGAGLCVAGLAVALTGVAAGRRAGAPQPATS
ncbi:MAG TPA: MFS transporter [Solirubrobacteraceae bacterium]|nr:MFS transporter [Solirubrobacteraceae bacterium]